MIDYAQIQRTARRFAARLPFWAAVDVNDLAQEAALGALRGRKSRDGAIQDLLRRQGWISNHRSRGRRRVELNERSHRVTPESKWSAAIDVHGLLGRLSPLQREAVELHYLAGMGEGEISEFLCIPIQRVKNRIHQGLKNLRRMV